MPADPSTGVATDPATDLAVGLAGVIVGAPDISDPATTNRAAVLLADHLWCVAQADAATSPWVEGVAETAARQAERGQLLDVDDVHWPNKVHPGAIVWATIMGIGDGQPGREWLRAAAVGYAVTVRLTAAVAPPHAERFHVTATAGALGALATAAVLVDADQATTATALAHALSLAGGSRGALQDRARATRAVHRAHAVRTGLGALTAALAGVPAATTADILRGGAFAAALPPTLEPGSPLVQPIDGTELAVTAPRRVPTEPLDPVTAEGLAVKWNVAADAASAGVEHLASALTGVARLSSHDVTETMTGLRPTRTASQGRPS